MRHKADADLTAGGGGVRRELSNPIVAQPWPQTQPANVAKPAQRTVHLRLSELEARDLAYLARQDNRSVAGELRHLVAVAISDWAVRQKIRQRFGDTCADAGIRRAP